MQEMTTMSLPTVLTALYLGPLDYVCNVCGKLHCLTDDNIIDGCKFFGDDDSSLCGCIDRRIDDGLAMIANSSCYRSIVAITSDIHLQSHEMQRIVRSCTDFNDSRFGELRRTVIDLHYDAQLLYDHLQSILTRNCSWCDLLSFKPSWLLALPAQEANDVVAYIRSNTALKICLLHPLLDSHRICNQTCLSEQNCSELNDRIAVIQDRICDVKVLLAQWKDQVEILRKQGFGQIEVAYASWIDSIYTSS